MKKEKPILRIISFIAVYFIVQFGVVIVLTIVAMAKHGIEAVTNNISLVNPLLSNVIASFIACLAYWLIFVLQDKNIFTNCKFNKAKLTHLILILGFGILMQFLLTTLMKLTKAEEIFPSHEELMEQIFTGGSDLMVFIGLVIAAPLVEELLFRGLIQNELRKKVSITWAIIIQALLFGLIHMNPLQSIYATIIGLFFGYIYLWTNSLWATIFAHMVVNGSTALLNMIFDYEKAIAESTIFLMLIGLVGIIFTMIYIYKSRVIVTNNENINDFSDNKHTQIDTI